MNKNISIVRNCKNCVKPRKSQLAGRFVCSNYVSSNADRVKGHRAKRLFTFNSKRVNREFDTKHNVGPSNTDEALIAQALKSQKELDLVPTELSVIDKAVERQMDEYQFGEELRRVRRQKKDKEHKAQHAAKEATNRQRRRIDFLKNPKNKICHICGTRGHVAKECTSIKRKQKVAKRTLNYKKHLVEQNKFKFSLDAEYKRLNDKIRELQAELSALRNRDDGFSSASIASSTQPDIVKVSQNPASQQIECRSTAEKYEITPRSKRSKPFVPIYDNFRAQQPAERGVSWFVRAQTAINFICGCFETTESTLLTLVVLLLAMVVSLSLINKAKDLYLSASTICIELVGNDRWKSYITYPSKSILFVIVMIFSILIFVLRRVLYKTDKMIEWEALSNYRNKLQQQGVTQRLPYKTSQIGTPDYSYTNRGDYQLSYKQTVAALSPISVLVFIAKATRLVFRDLYGIGYFAYLYVVRGLLLNKIAKPFFHFVSRLAIILGFIVTFICRFAMVLVTRHYLITTSVCLAVYVYGHMGYQTMFAEGCKLFNIGINWVSQTQKTVLAILASCFDTMAFRIRCITCLTSIAPTYARFLALIKGLLSSILGVWKHN